MPPSNMPVDTLTVKPASEADLPAILEIYNYAVLNTTATADYEPQTLESRKAWYEERLAGGYPVIVGERDGAVIGWAALSPYFPRYGYRFSAENSVYVAPEAQGQGVGRSLLGKLCEEADRMGLHSIIAKVDASNEASLRLHARFGFESAGYFRELIFKFDRWLDVVHLQRVR